jgi:hypothetical protein
VGLTSTSQRIAVRPKPNCSPGRAVNEEASVRARLLPSRAAPRILQSLPFSFLHSLLIHRPAPPDRSAGSHDSRQPYHPTPPPDLPPAAMDSGGATAIRLPYRHLRDAEVELVNLNGTSPHAPNKDQPPQQVPARRISTTRLVLACTVAAGVQFGWALQLSLLTPYIQVPQHTTACCGDKERKKRLLTHLVIYTSPCFSFSCADLRDRPCPGIIYLALWTYHWFRGKSLYYFICLSCPRPSHQTERVFFQVQPCVGVWSDKCRSKYGRRRPFILAGCLMICAAVS